jgi:hypothetical protein
MVVSFIGGGNRSIQRKLTTLPQVTDKPYHKMLYQVHITALVVKGLSTTPFVASVLKHQESTNILVFKTIVRSIGLS